MSAEDRPIKFIVPLVEIKELSIKGILLRCCLGPSKHSRATQALVWGSAFESVILNAKDMTIEFGVLKAIHYTSLA